jgi:hypothetical protein
MKKYLLLILWFVLIVVSNSLQAQALAEWQLPQVEIPLVQDGKTVATLKVRFISKSATITHDNIEYALKLKRNLNVCVITNRHTNEVVATLTKLGTSLIEVKPTEGNPFFILRTGKMKAYQYSIAGIPFLTVEDDRVIAGKQQSDRLELLAQATLVFRLVYKQYVSEKNSNNNYFPIITSAGTF